MIYILISVFKMVGKNIVILNDLWMTKNHKNWFDLKTSYIWWSVFELHMNYLIHI